jgi:monoamine oxidase
MPKSARRREYIKRLRARAWATLRQATDDQQQQLNYSRESVAQKFAGKDVVIIGSGIGGLTTAFEILGACQKHDVAPPKVTILEARDRTGGRCLTLRTGDTFTEDTTNNILNPDDLIKRRETQVVRFERPRGDSEPYLNAGPGRIPSSHTLLLGYLQHFGVPVEIYVMNSGANLVQMPNGPAGEEPVAYRHLEHNTRGWIAQMVSKNARYLLESVGIDPDKIDPDKDDDGNENCSNEEKLQSLMEVFGDLTDGEYKVSTATAGQDEDGSFRAGFIRLPRVLPGKIAPPFLLEELLKSEFWEYTRFYQPIDFLWQPTLFQPIGVWIRYNMRLSNKCQLSVGPYTSTVL